MFSEKSLIAKPLLLALVLAVSADCVSERLIEAALETAYSQNKEPVVMSSSTS
jgi:hypothetical protein